jgi:hypothetical protein
MSLSSARDLKGTILALPLEERRGESKLPCGGVPAHTPELIAALLWSLPRDGEL